MAVRYRGRGSPSQSLWASCSSSACFAFSSPCGWHTGVKITGGTTGKDSAGLRRRAARSGRWVIINHARAGCWSRRGRGFEGLSNLYACSDDPNHACLCPCVHYACARVARVQTANLALALVLLPISRNSVWTELFAVGRERVSYEFFSIYVGVGVNRALTTPA